MLSNLNLLLINLNPNLLVNLITLAIGHGIALHGQHGLAGLSLAENHLSANSTAIDTITAILYPYFPIKLV